MSRRFSAKTASRGHLFSEKSLVALFLFAFLVALPAGANALTSINACGILGAAGETYQLSASIAKNVTSNWCLNVTADNVVIDLNGYTITGDTDSAIASYACVWTNKNNTVVHGGTLTGCTMAVNTTGNFTNVYGVTVNVNRFNKWGLVGYGTYGANFSSNTFALSDYPTLGVALNHSTNAIVAYSVFTESALYVSGAQFVDVNDSRVEHNNFSSSSNDYAMGLELIQSRRVNASFNRFSMSGNTARGVILRGGSYQNNISFNSMSGSGAYAYPLYIPSGADNNTVAGNNISGSTAGGSYGHAVWDAGALNNSYYSNNVTVTDYLGDGYHFESSNSSVYGGNITCNGCRYSVYADASSFPTLTNATFIRINISGAITIKWVVDINASYPNGTPAAGFLVNVTNASSVPIFSSLPQIGANGLARVNLSEFWNSNYNFALVDSNGLPAAASQSVNVSQSSSAPVDIPVNFTFAVTGCTQISSNTVLSDNVSAPSLSSACFNITADNVVFDCAGFNITGGNIAGSIGVWTAKNNVTVRNCNISNMSTAIYSSGNYTTVYGNTVSVPANSTAAVEKWQGIELYNAWFGNITGNRINITSVNFSTYVSGSVAPYFSSGILLFSYTQNSSVYANNITTNGSSVQGISLYSYAANNAISNNNVTTLWQGSRVVYVDSHCTNNSVFSNNLTAFGQDSFGVYILSSSSRHLISNNTIVTFGQAGRGVFVDAASASNSIFGNNITTNGIWGYGVHILSSTSSGNSVFNNTVITFGGGAHAVFIDGATSNSVFGNNLSIISGGYGVWVFSSAYLNSVFNNSITTFGWGCFGIRFESAFNNSAISNNITTFGSNGHAVDFASSAYNNSVLGNNISTFGTEAHGLCVDSSSNNSLANNTVSTSGAIGSGFVSRWNSFGNVLSSNIFTVSNARAIMVGWDSYYDPYSNNSASFTNDIVRCVGSCTTDIFVNQSSNLSLVNVTFNRSRVVVDSNDTWGSNRLNISWYAAVSATFVNGTPAAYRFVNVSDAYAVPILPMPQTDANGLVTVLVGEYVITNGSSGGSATNRTPHLFELLNTDNTTMAFLYATISANASAPQAVPVLFGGESGCKSLSSSLTLNSSVRSNSLQTCFNITADNVVLDCAGYQIVGNNVSSSFGVWTRNNNVTVKNCYVSQFSTAIYIAGNNSNALNNGLWVRTGSSAYSGIKFQNAWYSNVTNNTAFSVPASVSCSTADDCAAGIVMQSCTNATVSRNFINASGTYAKGIDLLSTVLANLTFNIGYTMGSESQFLHMRSSSNNTILFNNISTGRSDCIRMRSYSSYNLVAYNNISTFNTSASSDYNIYVYENSNNFTAIYNNITLANASTTYLNAIRVYDSNGANVSYNTIYGPGEGRAIYFNNANYAYLLGNNVTFANVDGGFGFYFNTCHDNLVLYNNYSMFLNPSTNYYSRTGMELYTVSNFTIDHNTFSSTAFWGYSIYGETINNVSITYNNMTVGQWESHNILLYYATNNVIAYNNFTGLSSTWGGAVSLYSYPSNNNTVVYNTFRLYGYGEHCLRANAANNTNFSFNDCYSVGFRSAHGVNVYSGATNTTIEYNTITTGNYDTWGIRLDGDGGGSNAVVRHNTISTGVTYATTDCSSSHGITFDHGFSSALIEDNDISTHYGGSRGIMLYTNLTNISIRSNRITTLSGSSTSGITFWGTSNVTASLNNITCYGDTSCLDVNADWGYLSSNISITNNTITGLSSAGGVYVEGWNKSRDVTFQWNTVSVATTKTVGAFGGYNLDVRHNSFTRQSSSSGYGYNEVVTFYIESHDSVFEDNNVSGLGNDLTGIQLRNYDYYGGFLQPPRNITVRYNNVSLYGSGGMCIGLFWGDASGMINNTISRNNCTALGANTAGIWIGDGAHNNTIIDNRFMLYGSGSSSGYSVYLLGSTGGRDNSFARNYFYYPQAYSGVQSNSGSLCNATASFSDDIFVCTSCTYSAYVRCDSNVTFTNVSFDRSKISIASGNSNLFLRQWANANVSFPNGTPVSGHWVNASNAYGGFDWTNITNSSGMAQLSVYEGNYLYSGGNPAYFVNYTPNLFEALDAQGYVAAYNYSTISDSARTVPIQYPNFTVIPPETGAGCRQISTNFANFTLTQNASHTSGYGVNCFNITSNNVTLDCNGYSIVEGSGLDGSAGIMVTGNGTRIRNCSIRGFDYGILATTSNAYGINTLIVTDSSFHNESAAAIASTDTRGSIYTPKIYNLSVARSDFFIPSSGTPVYGIYLIWANRTAITDSSFRDSNNGTAVSNPINLNATTYNATVYNCSFYSPISAAQSTVSLRGEVTIDSSSLVCTNSSVEAYRLAGDGSGQFAFRNNGVTCNGGVYAYSDYSNKIVGISFTGNTFVSNASSGRGIALLVNYSGASGNKNVNLTNAVITGNSFDLSGCAYPGIALSDYNAAPSAADPDAFVNLTIANNTLYLSAVPSSCAGQTGISIVNVTRPLNFSFYGNAFSAALLAHTSPAFLLNSSANLTLYNNTAWSNATGLFVQNSTNITLLNNNFTTMGHKPAVSAYGPVGSVAASYNNITTNGSTFALVLGGAVNFSSSYNTYFGSNGSVLAGNGSDAYASSNSSFSSISDIFTPCVLLACYNFAANYSSHIYLLNSTYTRLMQVGSSAPFGDNEVHVRWYANVSVRNATTAAPVPGVRVAVTNASTYLWEGTNVTNSEGVTFFNLTEAVYSVSGWGGVTNYTPHLFEVLDDSNSSVIYGYGQIVAVSDSHGEAVVVPPFLYPISPTYAAGCRNLTASATLTQTVTQPRAEACFVVRANDVTLDCGGYGNIVTGVDGSVGVLVNGYNNTVIRNCRFSNFGTAVAIVGTSSGTLVEANQFDISNWTQSSVRVGTGARDALVRGNTFIVSAANANAVTLDAPLMVNASFSSNNISLGAQNTTGFWVYGSAANSTLLYNNTVVTAYNQTKAARFADLFGYKYLRRLSITNNNQSVLMESGYTVNLSLDTASLVAAGKLLPDCSDLRVFYDANQTQEIDRVNETACNSASTTIMFATQRYIAAGGADSNYYLAYGNRSALSAAPSNRSRVYAFYDDFSTDKGWRTVSGTWTRATNNWTAVSDASADAVVTIRAYSGSRRIYASMRWASAPSAQANWAGIDFRGNSSSTSDGLTGSVYAVYQNYFYDGSSFRFWGAEPNLVNPTTAWQLLVASVAGGNISFGTNLSSILQYSGQNALSENGNLTLRVRRNPNTVYFQKVWVQKFVMADPSISLAGEESAAPVNVSMSSDNFTLTGLNVTVVSASMPNLTVYDLNASVSGAGSTILSIDGGSNIAVRRSNMFVDGELWAVRVANSSMASFDSNSITKTANGFELLTLVLLQNASYANLSNNTISTSSPGAALVLESSNHSIVGRNSITTLGTNSSGIELSNSYNATADSNFVVSGLYSPSLWLRNASRATGRNNTLRMISSSSYALQVDGASNYLNFSSNNLSAILVSAFVQALEGGVPGPITMRDTKFNRIGADASYKDLVVSNSSLIDITNGTAQYSRLDVTSANVVLRYDQVFSLINGSNSAPLSATIIPASNYSGANATLAWRFEEGTGSAVSGADGYANLSGALVGSPSWVNGRAGYYALQFSSGQYAYADDNSLLDGSGNFSVFGRFKTTSGAAVPGNATCIACKSDGFATAGWQLVLNSSSGKASFGVSNGTVVAYANGTQNLSDSAWHSALGVFLRNTSTTATAYLYVDGALVAAQALNFSGSPASSYPFIVGAGNFTNSSFAGIIDDAAYFGQALSLSQAFSLDAAGLDASAAHSGATYSDTVTLSSMFTNGTGAVNYSPYWLVFEGISGAPYLDSFAIPAYSVGGYSNATIAAPRVNSSRVSGASSNTTTVLLDATGVNEYQNITLVDRETVVAGSQIVVAVYNDSRWVYWYNFSTAAQSSSCDSSVPQLSTLYVAGTPYGNSSWRGCSKDTDSDSYPDYFKIVVPTLNSTFAQGARFGYLAGGPSISSFTWSANATEAVYSNVTYSADISYGNQISYANLSFYFPNGTLQRNASMTLVSGDSFEGSYQYNFTPPLTGGNYSVYLSTGDANGFSTTQAAGNLSVYNTTTLSIYDTGPYTVGESGNAVTVSVVLNNTGVARMSGVLVGFMFANTSYNFVDDGYSNVIISPPSRSTITYGPALGNNTGFEIDSGVSYGASVSGADAPDSTASNNVPDGWSSGARNSTAAYVTNGTYSLKLSGGGFAYSSAFALEADSDYELSYSGRIAGSGAGVVTLVFDSAEGSQACQSHTFSSSSAFSTVECTFNTTQIAGAGGHTVAFFIYPSSGAPDLFVDNIVLRKRIPTPVLGGNESSQNFTFTISPNVEPNTVIGVRWNASWTNIDGTVGNMTTGFITTITVPSASRVVSNTSSIDLEIGSGRNTTVPVLLNSTGNAEIYGMLATVATAADVRPDAAGAWHFYDGSGTTLRDSSLRGNPMYFRSGAAPSWVADGVDGYGLSFSGSQSAYSSSPSFDFGVSNLTVCAWVKPNASASEQFVAGRRLSGKGYAVLVRSDGTAQAYISDGATAVTVNSTANVSGGAWHHLAASFDRTAGTAKLFVDGALSGSQSIASVGNVSVASNFSVGSDLGDASQANFSGSLDEVKVFSSAFNSTFANLDATFQYAPLALNASWFSFQGPDSYMTPTGGLIDQQVMNVTITVPSSRRSGVFSGFISLNKSEGNSVIIPVSVSVPSNSSWHTNYDNLSVSTSPSTTVVFANLTLYNDGNVDQNFSLAYYGGTWEIISPYVSPQPAFVSVPLGTHANLTFTFSFPNTGSQSFYLNMSSSNATPVYRVVLYNISLADQPPFFYSVYAAKSLSDCQTGVNSSVFDANSTVYLCGHAGDDQGLNSSVASSPAFVRINSSASSISASQVLLSSARDKTYGAQWPAATGAYSFNLTVFDVPGGKSNTSQNVNFSVVGTTTVSLEASVPNQTVYNVTASTARNLTVNISVVNSGSATARNLYFGIDSPIGWTVYSPAASNVSAGSSNYSVFDVTVPAGTLAATYPVVLRAYWQQPSGGTASRTVSQDAIIAGTSELSLENTSSTLTVSHSNSSSGWFVVRNKGNQNLYNVNVSCYLPTCANVSFRINGSTTTSLLVSTMPANAALNLSYSLSVPTGFSNGTYPLNLRADPNLTGVEAALELVSLEVPQDYSWRLVPSSATVAVIAGASAAYENVTVFNDGNVVQAFDSQFDIGTYPSPSSLSCTADPSVLCLSAGDPVSFGHGNRTISIAYRAPSQTSSFTPTMTVFGGLMDSKTSSITFNAFSLDILLQAPTESAPTSSLYSGSTISTQYSVNLGGSPLSTGVNFSYFVDSSPCATAFGPSYSAGSWTASCTVGGNLSSALYKNWTMQTTYASESGSISVNTTVPRSLLFVDVWPPSANLTSLPDVLNGSPLSATISVGDNVNLSNTTVAILAPNGSVSATYSFGNESSINFTDSDTEAVGDYEVVINSTDTNGNSNYSRGYLFEAYVERVVSQPMRTLAGEDIPATLSFFRPRDNRRMISDNSSAGWFNDTLHVRKYDLQINFTNVSITLFNATINETTDSLFNYIDVIPATSVIVPKTAHVLKVFAIKPSIAYDNASIMAGYLDTAFTYEPAITLYRCSSWNYSVRECPDGWVMINGSRPDVITRKLFRYLPGFSAYALAEDVDVVSGNGTGAGTGNGTSGGTGGTTTYNTYTYNTVNSGSSGASGGGITATDLANELNKLKAENAALNKQLQEQIDKMTAGLAGANASDADTYRRLKELLNATQGELGMQTQGQTVYLELYNGEATQVSLSIKNTLNHSSSIVASADGQATEFVSFEQSALQFASGQERSYKMIIRVPPEKPAGLYYGDVVFRNEKAQVFVPVNIRVLPSKEGLLDLKIQPLTDVVAPGGALRNEISIYNLGETKRVDVQLVLQLLRSDNDAVVKEQEEAIAIDTTLSVIKTIDVPADIPEGKYLVRAIAHYSNPSGRQLQAASLATVLVQKSIFEQTVSVLGIKIPVMAVVVFVVMSIAIWALYVYEKAEMERKKRYLEKVDFTKLPKPGDRAGFVGLIAETKVRAFIDLDRLQMHTLIAGASGSGKTVAAQVIIEEALNRGVSVMLFDPTAQWTGFLRPQRNPKMIQLFSSFGMKRTDVRAYPGNIIYVEDPNMPIDVKKFMKPGEITIFVLTKLQIRPRESPNGKPEASTMEIFVSNTIQRIFESNLDESPRLRLLLVYDEVHRLLPKFGGSGLGFTQIERGAREFRKWGLGLILISQVLSDFVGEIKANIGTEIQMRTKYEGDLERVKLKFGEDTLRSIVKASIGTGMMHSAEYNNGLPYFVTFRPLLHDVVRLSDDELAKYAAYNAKLDRTSKRLELLKNSGVDVFDLELELDLARDKMKKGSFNLVDVYLDSVDSRVDQLFAKYGLDKK